MRVCMCTCYHVQFQVIVLNILTWTFPIVINLCTLDAKDHRVLIVKTSLCNFINHNICHNSSFSTPISKTTFFSFTSSHSPPTLLFPLYEAYPNNYLTWKTKIVPVPKRNKSVGIVKGIDICVLRLCLLMDL